MTEYISVFLVCTAWPTVVDGVCFSFTYSRTQTDKGHTIWSIAGRCGRREWNGTSLAAV